MENGNILILKNLESVYPSLYDLFNQNFTVISKKHYSRLAVGSNTNSFAYVHKDFRCIVNVEIPFWNPDWTALYTEWDSLSPEESPDSS